ncbi:MAG: protein kinase [Ignavibacteriales bacterium]|nr:protein kinase [Ignavibacteriales bacterium]
MPTMIGQTISHYKIVEKLGEGGMGVVYKAHDTTLDRDVALKFLPAHVSVSEETKARFLQEAKAAAALNHAHICTIHGIEEADSSLFIVMEYIEGGTLREKLPFPKVNDALSIAIQIGEALQEAHSKGIVHRDIKADNVMLTSKGQAKVMDFGLAKLKGTLKLTKTSSTVGTLAYMAPEQIQGGEINHRSDIFSFGVLLFEMLTGKLPFRGEHEAAMMYSILNEQPDPLQKHLPDVSSELVHVLNRSLEKDPEDRYQHVDDMVSELRRVQKQSARVSRTPLGEMSTRPSDRKTPETHEIDHAPPGHRSTDHPQKRARQFIVLGTIVFLILVGFIGYVAFFGRHQSIDSIAVLPFTNVGADPNTEYLSDGITESLINTLSQLSNLTVMSRSSVFQFKNKEIDPQKAGKELGVKAVLVGRVTQRGDNLQISTELVDVSNNSHIWGEQYNKKLSDIFTVQEGISKDISQRLSLKLVGEDEKKLAKRYTESAEAYQYYLKGRFHWNKRNGDDLQKAVEYFKQAIEKDPGYALAYAGLASTYAVLPEYSGLAATGFISKTETAARKALELDATLAEPHAALGLIKYAYQWDWQDADREFMRAIELDPNSPTTHHWYSNSLENQGKLQEALAEIKRAQELDPLSPVITNNVGEILAYMQHYDLATEQFNKALELDPNQPGLHGTIAFVHTQQGRFDEAITELEKARQIVGANSPYVLGDLGYVYAKAGKKAEAIRNLDQLLEFSKHGYMVAVQIAGVYVGLGDAEKAFEWLEKGYNEHNTQLSYLKIDPLWSNLRSDSRYFVLLKKIRLDK